MNWKTDTNTHQQQKDTHTHNDMHFQLTHNCVLLEERISQERNANGNLKHSAVHTSIIKHTHMQTHCQKSHAAHIHVMTEADSLLTEVLDNGSKLSPKRLQSACNLVLSELFTQT